MPKCTRYWIRCEKYLEQPFIQDVYNWLDLISVVPWYLEVAGVGGSNLTQLRTIRMFRIFKIFRRFSDTEVRPRMRNAHTLAFLTSRRGFWQVLVDTIDRVKQPLIVPVFFFFLFTFVFGSLIFYFEPCYDIDDWCVFDSVSDAMYFCMVTMTTVGYGDQVPIDWRTRLLAMIIMLFGSLFLSMPLSVIGSEFDAVWKEKEKDEEKARKLKEDEERRAREEAEGKIVDDDAAKESQRHRQCQGEVVEYDRISKS